MPPVLLGREIDNPARAVEFHTGHDEHFTDAHFARRASRRISLEVFREPFLEHQGDALAHDADGVDRVHQSFHASVEEIALGEFHALKNTNPNWFSQSFVGAWLFSRLFLAALKGFLDVLVKV